MPSASARFLLDSPSAHRQGESAARAVLAEALVHHPMSVTYGSRGRVLVLGPEAEAKAAAVRLQDVGLQTHVLADGRASVALQGHLGDFRVVGVHSDQSPPDAFDLVLDLSRPPLLAMELTPPGYFAPGDDPQRLEDALAELPELVGEFDKPRFFSYDPSICAHGARGLTGCTRCLDACPTLAIQDLGERIEIDPYLCQGGGSCATVCPTGAVRYDCPPPSVLLTALRHALRAYREIAPERPVVLLHGSEAGRAWLDSLASGLPEPVIPMELEEVGSAGLETWLCALAFGAASVALLITGETPPSVRRALAAEVALGRELLTALGYPAQALRMLEADGRAASGVLTGGEEVPADLPAAVSSPSTRSGPISTWPWITSGATRPGGASVRRCPRAPLSAQWISTPAPAPCACPALPCAPPKPSTTAAAPRIWILFRPTACNVACASPLAPRTP